MQDKKLDDIEDSIIIPNVSHNDTSSNDPILLKNLSNLPSQHQNNHPKNSSYKNSCLGIFGIALFLGGRKEIVNFFKVHNFSYNPHLFDIHLSLALIIILATIRTLSSTLLKIDYIRYHSHQKEDESKNIQNDNKKSFLFAKWVVYINGFIAASAIFIPTYNTFHNYSMIICGIMAFYAVASSIYSSINYATPLIERMAKWFFLSLFGNARERKSAREKLCNTFFGNNQLKFKFLITTIGTITSSFFFFYSIHNTFQLGLSLPLEYCTGCAAPNYLWKISGALAVFTILWVLIPGYALTFREEANKAEAEAEANNKEINNVEANKLLQKSEKSSPTPSFQKLKDRCGKTNDEFINIISFALLYLFIGIGIICWLVSSLVLSVGTYIGAQHVFGSFACSIVISDAIFVIDFLYQLNYYSTELCRKIANKLMLYMPYSHHFFDLKENKQNEKDQLVTVDNSTVVLTPK